MWSLSRIIMGKKKKRSIMDGASETSPLAAALNKLIRKVLTVKGSCVPPHYANDSTYYIKIDAVQSLEHFSDFNYAEERPPAYSGFGIGADWSPSNMVYIHDNVTASALRCTSMGKCDWITLVKCGPNNNSNIFPNYPTNVPNGHRSQSRRYRLISSKLRLSLPTTAHSQQ